MHYRGGRSVVGAVAILALAVTAGCERDPANDHSLPCPYLLHVGDVSYDMMPFAGLAPRASNLGLPDYRNCRDERAATLGPPGHIWSTPGVDGADAVLWVQRLNPSETEVSLWVREGFEHDDWPRALSALVERQGKS